MKGFIGEHLLVNLTDGPFIAAAGRIYLFRALNGSTARAYKLAFLQDGRRLGYHLIGTDGGLLASAQRVDQAFISTGQRLDLLLDLREAKEGRPVRLATLAFDTMHAEGGAGGAMAGMNHSKTGEQPMQAIAMEGDARALLRIDVKGSPDYTRAIAATLSSLPGAKTPPGGPRRIKLALDGNRRWTINGLSYDSSAVRHPAVVLLDLDSQSVLSTRDLRHLGRKHHLFAFVEVDVEIGRRAGLKRPRHTRSGRQLAADVDELASGNALALLESTVTPTLFTFGLFLLTTAPVPRRLLVIPVIWSLLGGQAVFRWGVLQDCPLIVSGAILLVLLRRDADRRRDKAERRMSGNSWAGVGPEPP